MENILQKLKKIKARMDRGSTVHERDTARRMLMDLLKKYNYTLDDLVTPEKRRFYFNFFTATEKNLLFQIVAHITQESTVTWWRTRNTRKIGFDLTPIQAAMVQDYWEAYREPLKAEIKKYIDTLFSAYISKHKLFAPSSGDSNGKPIDIDLLRAMVRNLSEVERPVKKIGE